MNSERQAVVVEWIEGQTFEGGVPGGPRTTADGTGTAALSPVSQLLVAAAACSGIDVVDILKKMRVDVQRCRVEASARRRDDYPRRLVDLHLVFVLAGKGVDEDKARRAIELSVTKYCSVIQSLNPDIPVTWDIRLE